jgi:hypothetical protein
MRSRIAAAGQAVVRGPSLTGVGKRPDLTPDHQLLFETGMSSRMSLSRTNPSSGNDFGIARMSSFFEDLFKLRPERVNSGDSEIIGGYFCTLV